MDRRHTIAGHVAYALKMLQGLIDHDIDVASVADAGSDRKAGLGHAFGFIANRLFRGRAIPMVPLLLNTYYRPNVPVASRCHAIGRALRRVIDADGLDLRVAIVGSGGLSHFVVDEALDRGVMDAIASGDPTVLRRRAGRPDGAMV